MLVLGNSFLQTLNHFLLPKHKTQKTCNTRKHTQSCMLVTNGGVRIGGILRVYMLLPLTLWLPN